ncbi:MAG: metallophosphoesterase family protein [Brumimicrobium sp.]|nr:metallophosphoesterase family protein [Brumimicrobium sp.]
MVNNKYLFFGGSYSNFHAIQRLKETADELGIPAKNIFHTGDVVGYCAFPEETVRFVRDWGIQVIAGNVEIQLANGENDCGCNFDEGSRCADFSTLWYPYAQTQLSEDSISWMRSLPLYLSFELNNKRWSVIHGGIKNISEFIFASSPWEQKEQIFKELGADVVIAGHCGLPFFQKENDKIWINPGVIGMPANDGTSRVWYGIYDASEESFEIKSLNYRSDQARKQMYEKQLPPEYADTLITGIWDNCEILPDKETAVQGTPLEEKKFML